MLFIPPVSLCLSDCCISCNTMLFFLLYHCVYQTHCIPCITLSMRIIPSESLHNNIQEYGEGITTRERFTPVTCPHKFVPSSRFQLWICFKQVIVKVFCTCSSCKANGLTPNPACTKCPQCIGLREESWTLLAKQQKVCSQFFIFFGFGTDDLRW